MDQAPTRLPSLLVVDDDDAITTQLRYALQDDFTVTVAGDRAGARAALDPTPPAVALVDLGLPPHPDSAVEGLRLLEEMLDAAPGTKVVILTASADLQAALRAVQLGAFDYHTKPVDLDALRVVLQRAAHMYRLDQESASWIRSREEAASFETILGATPAMREIFALIERVARTDATVLIEGESGTGKELIARAIHQRSLRRDGPFVAINCAAIPETLLEAELFGHEKGAFTGAHVKRGGKLEMANQGTLFLDEIAELSLLLQVKLLRFLQERTIERVGGREEIRLDLRVIAATNRELKTQIDRAHFREDLYYRLSVITIRVPPLRDRGQDVILLANAFLRRSGHTPRRRLGFSQEALRAMLTYPWPGNIRELENKVQRAVIMAKGRVIGPAELDLQPATAPSESGDLREVRARAERQALVESLIRHRGNISRAALALGVSRPTFHGLLDKHRITAREFR